MAIELRRAAAVEDELMKQIRLGKDDLKGRNTRRWGVWAESRVATFLSGIGIVLLVVGMVLYLMRHYYCFGFLASGAVAFLFAVLFDIIGGRIRKRTPPRP